MYILALLSLLMVTVTTEILVQKTIEVATHDTIHLNCYNRSEGLYKALLWNSNAYSDAMYSIYSIGVYEPETISVNYKHRIRRTKGANIEISNTQLSDQGIYECSVLYHVATERRAKNDSHQNEIKVGILAKYKVVVVTPPIIARITPEEPNIIRHRSFSIICEAKSQSPFNLTWRKHKGQREDRFNVRINETYHNGYFNKVANLTIFNMTSLDIGKYVCVARNLAGKFSKKIKVHMLVLPTIISPERFNANIGDTAVLNCNASSHPAVTFEWEFFKSFQPIKLKPLEVFEKYSVRATTSKRMPGNIIISSSSLVIRNIQRDDWRVYVCFVKNKIGDDQKDIEVLGYSVPDQPEILYAKKSTNQMTLYWNYIHNGGRAVTMVTIEYRIYGSFSWKKIQISELSGKKYTVTNLTPATLYEFRVLLQNRIGDSHFSATYTAETTKRVLLPSSKKSSSLIGKLNIVAIVSICGATLLLVTCLIGGTCIYLQGKRLKSTKREREREKKDMEMTELRLMNNYS